MKIIQKSSRPYVRLTLDILELPDVFLRQLMRKVDLRDRLSLRLTCRALEELVANSHAGHCEECYIRHSDPCWFRVEMGGISSKNCHSSSRNFPPLLSRMFMKISLGKLRILGGDNMADELDCVLIIAEKSTFEKLDYIIENETQFENSLPLILQFNPSKNDVTLRFKPTTAQIRLLTDLNDLRLFVQPYYQVESGIYIRGGLIFSALDVAKDLLMGIVALTVDELMKMLQILSMDARKRIVQFAIKPPIIEHWLLTHHGITVAFAEEDFSKEVVIQHRIGDAEGCCLIKIWKSNWIGAPTLVNVSIRSSNNHN